jgi:hypothetical protein
MTRTRALWGGAGALALLAVGVAPASAAPLNNDGCTFSRGTTTCVTSSTATTTYDAPDGVEGTRTRDGETVWGDTCLAFHPTTWYYGAFPDTSVEVSVTTTTTVTYEGRVARHDKKRSSVTTVAPPSYRITSGEVYCYTNEGARLYRLSAPYPS